MTLVCTVAAAACLAAGGHPGCDCLWGGFFASGPGRETHVAPGSLLSLAGVSCQAHKAIGRVVDVHRVLPKLGRWTDLESGRPVRENVPASPWHNG
ncbi:MAG: hypothetical protein OXG15_00055 [Gammaproteobacteria bacterium]|nr:hypothetical protein [Gammaproteobacteria bacterium]